MNVIVFCNRTVTPDFGTKFLGHVGWGFQLANGHFLYGSKEASPMEFATQIPNIPGVIHQGNPNGVFVKEAGFDAMIRDIKAGGQANGPRFLYHEYKLLTAPKPHPDRAAKMAVESKGWGYGLAGNNCMDDVYKIITCYADGDENFLPWPITHPFPNHFFHDIPGPAQALNPF